MFLFLYILSLFSPELLIESDWSKADLLCSEANTFNSSLRSMYLENILFLCRLILRKKKE